MEQVDLKGPPPPQNRWLIWEIGVLLFHLIRGSHISGAVRNTGWVVSSRTYPGLTPSWEGPQGVRACLWWSVAVWVGPGLHAGGGPEAGAEAGLRVPTDKRKGALPWGARACQPLSEPVHSEGAPCPRPLPLWCPLGPCGCGSDATSTRGADFDGGPHPLWGSARPWKGLHGSPGVRELAQGP